MLSMEMLQEAQRILDPVINHTPVVATRDIVPDCDFYLKADCLQKTGAFKLRGAYYKIATLSDEEKKRGVIACSAGNHAQGVAFAARDMGIPATICIPEGAPLSKIEATRSYGANVVLVPGVYDDARCKVIGVQAAGAASMVDSIHANRILTLPSVHTIADGIQVKTPGDLTFDLVRQYVDDVVTVKEGEIASAILTVLEKQKLVAEGAGAVGIAAAMYGKVDVKGKKVCALLSGGNVDVTMLERIITRGLAKERRTASFATVLPDRPRAMTSILNIISETGANVLDIHHERRNTRTDIGSCIVQVSLETRNAQHIKEIYEKLRENGYEINE